jgi:PHD/YefM family antitoxin component YafN of YafNO toxin-antitoxin module
MPTGNRKRPRVANRQFELGSGELVAEMRKAGGSVVLTRKGRATGVALNMKSYRHMMDQVDELETFRGIKRGLDDFAAGRSMSLGEFRRRMEGRFAVSRANRRKRGR